MYAKIAAALFFLLLLPASALTSENLRSVTVMASSTINAKAEHATLHAQLKIVSNSLAESYAQLTASLKEIAAALEPLGITKDDLVVSVINQGQEYNWDGNTRTASGFSSECSLRIRNTDLEGTYRLHQTLAGFKNLTIGHTEYGRDDVSLLHTAALQQALQSAEAKARAMAETLGAQLGEVQRIRETGNTPIVLPRMAAAMADAGGDPGTVTTTGSVTVTGDVEVEFALK